MRRLALLLALGLGAAGCTGSIGDMGGGSAPGPSGGPGPTGSNGPGSNPPGSNGPGPSGSNDPAAPPSAQISCTQNGKDAIGRRTLRRLTNGELEATIRGAFGLTTQQWSGLTVPPDPGSKDGFTNNVDRLTVSPDYVRGARESGRKVATLVSTEPLLGQLLPCAAGGGQACADTFVTTFGAKLFRRPLTAAEKTRYLSLFAKTGGAGDFKGFVYWATTTMLQSPNAIYRTELGEPDGAGRYKLTPYEVASGLSFTFTGGPPSDALLALAAAGKLSTADELESATRLLILDGNTVRPAFREVITRFTDQWMGLASLSNLKKDDMAFPDFNTTIQDALGEETRRFMAGVMLEGRGKVADMLTAPYTFVDARLAKYYGLPAPAGAEFVKVDRPAGWGVGLLAQGSLLAVKAHSLHTSPTKRGHLVRAQLMCNEVPPPPAVVGELPEPTETDTTRQRYEVLHAADAGCNACHRMMDPIGYAFEHLDASGRYRAKEGKFEIDDSGTIFGSSKGELKFKGQAELAAALAQLPEVNQCWASNIAAFAFGVSHESGACLVASATKDLTGGISLLDFYLRMARADHFRIRQP